MYGFTNRSVHGAVFACEKNEKQIFILCFVRCQGEKGILSADRVFTEPRRPRPVFRFNNMIKIILLLPKNEHKIMEKHPSLSGMSRQSGSGTSSFGTDQLYCYRHSASSCMVRYIWYI